MTSFHQAVSIHRATGFHRTVCLFQTAVTTTLENAVSAEKLPCRREGSLTDPFDAIHGQDTHPRR